MSAYFYFSNTFIIVPHKRLEIRKVVIVMSIQWQTSSRTDFGSTLHRAGWSNNRLQMLEMAIAILLWGKSKILFVGPPPQRTTVRINILIISIHLRFCVQNKTGQSCREESLQPGYFCCCCFFRKSFSILKGLYVSQGAEFLFVSQDVNS